MRLIALQARIDFCADGQTRSQGEIFEVTPIEAVRLRQRGVVNWAPPAAKRPPAKVRRTYRRRDLVAES